jgi:hypothetical protein
LAQKDKTPALAGQCRATNDRVPGKARSRIGQAIRASTLAAFATVAWQSPVPALEMDYRVCLPARLHPVSAKILSAFLAGRLTESDFRWGFHLPNSDYLPVGECILAALHGKPFEACESGSAIADESGSCFSY